MIDFRSSWASPFDQPRFLDSATNRLLTQGTGHWISPGFSLCRSLRHSQILNFIGSRLFDGKRRKLGVLTFIDFSRQKNNEIVLKERFLNFQLNLFEFYKYLYFSHTWSGENLQYIHTSFSPASLRGEETGSSVPFCRSQGLSLFMLPKATTRPLPVWDASPLPCASNSRLFRTPKLNSAEKCTMTQWFTPKRRKLEIEQRQSFHEQRKISKINLTSSITAQNKD